MYINSVYVAKELLYEDKSRKFFDLLDVNFKTHLSLNAYMYMYIYFVYLYKDLEY